MMKILAGRGSVAAALWASMVSAALASGDTGTGAVAEMDVGIGTLLALIAGVAGMGVVIWILTKTIGKGNK
jgi:hypothetical protein